MKPYVAGIQPQGDGWIKLNTNEKPYPTDVKLDLDLDQLRLYPSSDSDELRTAIATKYQVDPENVFCGNGSDEVLALIFQAFFCFKKVYMPDISYGFYPVWSEMYHTAPVRVPLVDWKIDWSEYIGSSIIANPNPPTGHAFDIQTIPSVGVTVIDEAYIDFANVPSAIPLTKIYDNLLVVRTFSKSYSLAGLRVGFAIGHKKLIQTLNDYKNCFNSYPLDQFAQKIATAALKQPPNVEKVIETRDWLKTKINCLDSQGNFLFWEVENSKEMYEYLLEHKILVRYWDYLPNHLRVSIGTQEEMEAFLSCIEKRTKRK